MLEIRSSEESNWIKEESDIKDRNDVNENTEVKNGITGDMDSISMYKFLCEKIESINYGMKFDEKKYFELEKMERERIEKKYFKWKMKIYDILRNYEEDLKKRYNKYLFEIKIQHTYFTGNTLNRISQYVISYINLLKIQEIKSFLRYQESIYGGEYSQLLKKSTAFNAKHIQKYYENNIVKYSALIKEAEQNKVHRNARIMSKVELLNFNLELELKNIIEHIEKHYKTGTKEDRWKCIERLIQLDDNIEQAKEICRQLKDEILSQNEKGIDEVIIATEQYLEKYEADLEQDYTELERYITRHEEEHLKEINMLNKEYRDYVTDKKKEFNKGMDYYRGKIKKDINPYICEQRYRKDMCSHIDIDDYECPTEISENVLLGWINVKRRDEQYVENLNSLLEEEYSCYYKLGRYNLPYTLGFDKNFRFVIETLNANDYVKDVLRNILLKILMVNQPGKVKLTLFDTVGSGDAFAMFGRIVSRDDRTNKIINGQIWTQQRDMQEKLDVIVAHISNVIQRCLQGKYENILTYNKDAKQNAEPYNIISIMDFPANFNEQMLKNLERIVENGARCGVFTIISKNNEEMKKLDPKLQILADGICNKLNKWHVEKEQIKLEIDGRKIDEFTLELDPMPVGEKLEEILEKLKAGIKDADKVVIEYDDSIATEKEEMLKGSTLKGIRVPIGVHGVNEQQFLTLGVGGAQHALIAGQTGSGKSSLLHTIITSLLCQYSEEELNIYLVDFKRGVEFKTYAKCILPVFKVIAIESEKEFGFNVLEHLEREQKIRADLFKKNNDVTNIEEYRNETGKPMPRILVIIDEFHELFSSENDGFSKKAAIYLERIVRQGRAFGIHIILASQSLSNISGISKSVLDQMAVRIALKCSETDAAMLLEDGGNIIKQIATDDAGKAIYNSEGGDKTANTEFRISYLESKKHKELLHEIEQITENNDYSATRILLNNIEDNPNNIFNRFTEMHDLDKFRGQPLFLGETVSIVNNLNIQFENEVASNLLIVGNEDDTARNMFAFSVLSLCISAWLRNGKKAPNEPVIYLMNFKPLEDEYFTDLLELEGTLLSKYVRYSSFRDSEQGIKELHKYMEEKAGLDEYKYLLVYGLQNANVLKNDSVAVQRQDLMRGFPSFSGVNEEQKSTYQMFKDIMICGPKCGIHSVIWHNSYSALDVSERTLTSYFDMRIGYSMSRDEYAQFINENSVEVLNENNAIYYNRIGYNQRFRPYGAPSEEWVRDICSNLEK